LTKPVAVNTGLALPRSLWQRLVWSACLPDGAISVKYGRN